MDHGEGSSTTRIVDDLLDDSLDVAIPLRVVNGTKSGCALAVLDVTLEDGTSSLTLGTDHTTHFESKIYSKAFERNVAGSSRKRKRKHERSADDDMKREDA